MRAIAAVLVVLFHASLTEMLNPFADTNVADGYKLVFSKAGWLAVSFFFVLSGFVLTWSARPTDTVTGFWKRRLLKIYPNHIVVFALSMVLFAAATAKAAVWLPNLLLIHSWFPRETTFISINQPAWSLCAELLFYLIFPFVIPVVRRMSARALWSTAAAMVTGMVALQVVVDLFLPQGPITVNHPLSEPQWWISYNFPPSRLFEFILGMVMARLVMAGKCPRIGLAPAALLMAAGYAVALVVPWQYGLTVAMIVPIAVLVCSLAQADVADRHTFLRSRTMIWLGEISFATYMFHFVVLVMAGKWLDGRLLATPAATALVVAALLVSLLGGWLLYVGVERPVMRRFGRTRPKPGAVGETPAPREQPREPGEPRDDREREMAASGQH
ncbi:acyltransferase [Streptomyces sp. NPDC059900]|uniref:acyltransferase family protein n=1 Tax=Streptomyces sp. NPDC059900 TaxID=3155816 RepID=UPI00343EA784